ncbi:MAG: UDP-N-acetylmuramoyl-L-alanyl-D-glutamate--2,6-diaminopimelate ligase [gamma proteobacterium symbiont of Taylorina sp.]|nr:UDP-N-acetylmuramoyl-L-alanyl-D-glutamate--2,6-diaminopimelate ligase [gamma proteobacterium symbiont of Taylorina sp.]
MNLISPPVNNLAKNNLGQKEKNLDLKNHLQTLLDGFVDLSEVKNYKPVFKGLSSNSKKIHEDFLFFASAGSFVYSDDNTKKWPQHGIAYAGDAINHGAILIAWEPTEELKDMPASCTVKGRAEVPLIRIESLHEKIGEIAARFYQHPSHDMDVVGITGTNGKTSIAHFIAQVVHEANDEKKCAVIGTLGNGFYGGLEEGTHTTPDAVTLQTMMADFRDKQANMVVMEVSSHALAQSRVNGVEFNTAVFSNLSRDHLDYHGDMECYGGEKLKLFKFSSLKNIVINLDDSFSDKIFAQLQIQKNKKNYTVVSYSKQDKKADYYAHDIVMNGEGISFNLSVVNNKRNYSINNGLLGDFNIDNCLASIAVLHQHDYELDDIAVAMSKITTVPGRMEKVASQPLIVIDYAHTPDALEKALLALKPHTKGQLYCLFGCGGDRDKGKRPLMAKVAELQADVVMLTSDNPRTEAAQQIIADSMAGFRVKDKVFIEVDREQAIRKVVESAQADDVILIAGKGHENYQDIQGQKFPFSDKSCVLSMLETGNSLNLSQLASALKIKNTQSAVQSVQFSSVSINSRTLKKGDLFVAIRGENFDAHDYIEQAEKNGACAVIVEKKVATELPLLCVKDSRLALGQIALLWRLNFSLPVIAVTGSCGKTTVKEMTAAILRNAFYEVQGEDSSGAVLATRGNLNNDIGVPLTLLELNKKHQAAVIELGANHIGEIEHLVKLVQPDVALITNAAHAHIEGFGSIAGVAQAKSEIYGGLRNNGTAIINADDDFAAEWIKCNQQAIADKRIRLMTFGLRTAADVSADYQQTEDGVELLIKTPIGNQSVILQQYGQHNIYNALAAAAAAISAGCSLLDVKLGLESFTEVSGRFERKEGFNGLVVFDDTYNANPGSVKAGIEALKQVAAGTNKSEKEGQLVLILGDMGELGEESKQLHYQLGIDIADLGIQQLLTVGENSQKTYQAYCAQIEHLKKENAMAEHFSAKKELVKNIENRFTDGDMVLVKGSRSMKMEEIVTALMNVADIGAVVESSVMEKV